MTPIHHKYREHHWIYQSSENVDGRRHQIDTCACGAVRERSWKIQKKRPYSHSKRPFPNKVARVPKLSKTLQNGSTRKRKGIRAVSDKRKVWNAIYRDKYEADPQYVPAWDIRIFMSHEVEVFRTAGYRGQFERHHPFRRIKWCILLYRYVTPELHEWLESNSTHAREMGLLYDVERGELRNPSPHDPFQIIEEFKRTKDAYKD